MVKRKPIPRGIRVWLWEALQFDQLEAAIQDEYDLRATDEFIHPFPTMCLIANSTAFEICVAVLIIVNCVIVGWNLSDANPRKAYGEVEDSGPMKPSPALEALTVIVCAFWLMELVIRLCSTGWTWIFHKLHFLEFVLIVMSTAEVFVFAQVGVSVAALRYLSILRVFRLAQWAKYVGRMPYCREIRMLSRGMSNSLAALWWFFVLLFCITFMFGVVSTEYIGYGAGFDDVEWVGEYFGNVADSMFTLFQITTLDRWTSIARPLMENAGWVGPFFILFISLTNWIVLSLLVAVLLDSALRAVREDDAEMEEEEAERRNKQAKQLHELFDHLDEDGNKTINENDWRAARHHPTVVTMLKDLGMAPGELEDLWMVLDDGDHVIEISKFVETMRRWKIKPSMADMMVCMKQIRNCVEQVDTSDQRIADIQTEIGLLKDTLRDLHRQQAVLLRACKKLELRGAGTMENELT
eukprot:GEMP01028786.1.p1 GENE.GEMP01028786.1~~GEMP01028786.1.p1  ORF type:complete len:467 (+),score=113.79 GEMP01028786.1:185-1585(+)